MQLHVRDGQLKVKAPTGVLNDELKARLRAHKDELVDLLQQIDAQRDKQAKAIKAQPIEARESGLPLSFAQQRMWLLNQIEPESSAYNMSAAMLITGEINESALQTTINALQHRHEILRTVYSDHPVDGEDSQPQQAIRPASDIEISRYSVVANDLKNSAEQSESPDTKNIPPEVTQWLKLRASEPFDLSQDAMLRVQYVVLSDQQCILQWVVHHIAVDAWSIDILSQEFAVLYQLASESPESNPKTIAEQLPRQSIQYADFAHWQREWLDQERIDKQLGYWRTHLGTDHPVLQLPSDISRSKKRRHKAERVRFSLDTELAANITALSQTASNLSPFILLLAVLQKLLHDYSSQPDVRVGVPSANRHHHQTQSLVGCFVNTLVMKADFSGEQSLAEFLEQMRQSHITAQDHQDVPFELLVDELVSVRDPDVSPLFQVAFNFLQKQQKPNTSSKSNGSVNNQMEIELLRLNHQQTIFDLILSVETTGDDHYQCAFEYDCDLYSQQFIQTLAEQYQTLLAKFVEAIREKSLSTPLAKISLLSDQEQRTQQVEWNQTDAPYPVDKVIHELFEAQASANPDALALVYGSEKLSYAELNRRANRLALYLVEEKAVTPDTLVGICFDRSIDMLVGLLAILKAGGAYLPLDPSYPPARLSYMLEDSRVDIVLTQKHLLATLSIIEPHALCVDEGSVLNSLSSCEDSNLDVSELGLTPSNLAYVIYTSGSTGQPKA